MDKQELLRLLLTTRKNGGIKYIHEFGFAKKFSEIYNEICSMNFPKDFVFKQKLYHYIYNDNELNLGKCKYCGNRVTFKSLEDGYCEYCSKTCCQRHFVYLDQIGERKRVCGFAINNNREKARQTMLERHGVENPQQLKSVKEKSIKTKHERYGKKLEKITEKTKHTKLVRHGDENYNNHEQCVKTCLERYNVENVFAAEPIKEKIKDSCFEHFGVDHPMKSSEISGKMARTKLNNSIENKLEIKRKLRQTWDNKSKEEIEEIINRGKQTKLEIHGDENYSNRELYKETCDELYDGVGWGSPYLKEKSENTLKQKYSVKHNSKIYSINDYENLTEEQISNIEIYKNKQKEKYQQIYDEYILNGIMPTGGVSATELDIYKFLIETFDKENIEYQYSSEQYPFKCDFYLKNYDLYIELNAHWTHGGHPFDENNSKDIEQLNYWKSCNTKYYGNAINVWTKSDVYKRNIAKENNLNLLEIFSDNVEEIKKLILDHIKKSDI